MSYVVLVVIIGIFSIESRIIKVIKLFFYVCFKVISICIVIWFNNCIVSFFYLISGYFKYFWFNMYEFCL